jgi:hypothetical protein
MSLKKLAAILLCLCLLTALAPALAADSAPVSGGYIVRLRSRDGVRLFSAAHTVTAGIVTVDSRAELDALIAGGDALYWEKDYTVTLFDTRNDSYYPRQWNLKDIGAEAAWSAGFTGDGVRVAVIDSGIYREHEDLRAADIAPGESVISGVSGTADNLGHGTLVTGIIAAQSDNALGIAGISDQVTIVPIKCFANANEANVSDICNGIYKAVDFYHCDVICLSLGTPDDSNFLHQAVNYAADKGTLIVAAAGNDGSTGYFYPASYDSVVSVGSYESNGSVSSFSEKNDSVFVSAPGSDIYSTYIGKPNSYALVGGTSFAAPHVAAMAALAKSVSPGMNITAFKELLRETCRDAGDVGYDTSYGYGKVDLAAFAAFLADRAGNSSRFTDIAGHWAESDINFCVTMGVFDGVSETRFQPETAMTRAMLVTVLYRYDNGLHVPSHTGVTFTDVGDPSQWYYEAVYWAAGCGIVDGFADGSFHPEEAITREQLCTMLHRYALSPAPADASALAAFSDSASVSPFAVTPMTWAVSQGLVSGTAANQLSPRSGATRAQVAAILTRYITK